MSTISRFVREMKKKFRADDALYEWADASNGSDSMGAYLEVDWEALEKSIDEFAAEFKAKEAKNAEP